MTAPDRLYDAIHQCCRELYAPDVAHSCGEQLWQMLQNSALWGNSEPLPGLDETHVLLITYANTIEAPDEMPLATLHRMLQQHLSSISHVHLLPFFPYSSDDGFSVIDFSRVDTELGDWSHIDTLAQSHQLMFDFVLNHISRESVWFADFVSHHPPGKDYFIEVPRDTDVSAVVRPRSQRLLAPIYTRRGIQHVWATFSADQIDLNYGNPDVLQAMMAILISYLERGASMIRLDAVAFLWKQLGTSCIHLPQTHTIIRLMRLLTDALKPGCLLVSETNVPHAENLS
jgi:sucrose phosphorylase